MRCFTHACACYPWNNLPPCRKQLKGLTISLGSLNSYKTLTHLQALCVVRASSLQHAPKQRDLALEAYQIVVPALALEGLLLK